MQQHDALFAYYHGKAPSRPSQIKLLCSGGYGFEDLYDSKQKMATSKSDNTVTTEELILKKELHRDPVRTFRATKEINAIDLEKNRNLVHFLLPVAPYSHLPKKATNSTNVR